MYLYKLCVVGGGAHDQSTVVHLKMLLCCWKWDRKSIKDPSIDEKQCYTFFVVLDRLISHLYDILVYYYNKLIPNYFTVVSFYNKLGHHSAFINHVSIDSTTSMNPWSRNIMKL